jgi:rare lipoprotein A (peptidoglycan hydrolase)
MSMPVKKTMLSAVLLCALAPASFAALCPSAAAAASTDGSTGATVAPSGAPSPGNSSATQSQPSLSSQEGISLATWFGPGLFGNQTACGQVLTKRLIGVANRTLPCGTLVKVSYRGHNLTIPVVDRGPYGPLHAKWDLTQAAAKQLGLTETEKIDATIVGHTQNSPELGLPSGQDSPSSQAGKPAPSAGTTGAAAAA